MEDISEVYVSTSSGLNKYIFNSLKYEDVKESSIVTNRPQIPRENKVYSLFDECLNFIAVHLDCLESLNGFPSDVGRLLWDRALQLGLLSSIEDIHPFLEAYPSLIASSLNLSYSLRLINELDCSILPILSESMIGSLDLTGCKLGDDHEVLGSLWKMKWLQELNLSDNDISRKGLRILSLPRKTLGKLEILDLSRNPKVSPKDLSMYASLLAINLILEDTQEEDIQELQKSGFVLRSRPISLQIVSMGWIVSLLQKMREELAQRDSQSQLNRQRKGNFYRRGVILTPSTNNSRSLPILNKVMFTKNMKRQPSVMPSSQNKRKRWTDSYESTDDLNDILSMYK